VRKWAEGGEESREPRGFSYPNRNREGVMARVVENRVVIEAGGYEYGKERVSSIVEIV
jgi:hypothetical protein